MVNHHHRNVLYILIFILIIINIISFVSLSSKVSRTDAALNSVENRLTNLSDYLISLISAYESQNQRNFNDITLNLNEMSRTLSQQRDTFEQEIKLLKSSQGDFSEIVKGAVKSVVTIRTDDSMGTGFIIHKEGYLVTNYHVTEGTDKIYVITYDRELIPAKIIGSDKFRDLALLKIEGSYNPLVLADSSQLQVGNKVIAIGNPLGLSFTDTEGKVVGINNFKVGDAESLGFALESNALKNAINALVNTTLVNTA